MDLNRQLQVQSNLSTDTCGVEVNVEKKNLTVNCSNGTTRSTLHEELYSKYTQSILGYFASQIDYKVI